MIQISTTAVTKIKEMLSEEEVPNLFLRLGVRQGGCSGFSYGMGFDDELNETDKKFEFEGFDVVVDEDSSRFLAGLQIDYKEAELGGGFTMFNPNAVASCGCGSSFRTKEEAGAPSEC